MMKRGSRVSLIYNEHVRDTHVDIHPVGRVQRILIWRWAVVQTKTLQGTWSMCQSGFFLVELFGSKHPRCFSNVADLNLHHIYIMCFMIFHWPSHLFGTFWNQESNWPDFCLPTVPWGNSFWRTNLEKHSCKTYSYSTKKTLPTIKTQCDRVCNSQTWTRCLESLNLVGIVGGLHPLKEHLSRSFPQFLGLSFQETVETSI